jgi:hypothetical protein
MEMEYYLIMNAAMKNDLIDSWCFEMSLCSLTYARKSFPILIFLCHIILQFYVVIENYLYFHQCACKNNVAN